MRDSRARRLLAGTLAAALASTAPAAWAGTASGDRRADAPVSHSHSVEPGVQAVAPADDDDLFSELAKNEDEGLARHVAGDLSTGEIILVVLLLIFLFPIGLIVLIILLVTDD